MNIKSLLLGSAAALLAVSGARAADVIVAEPEPVEYVRVCDAYGAGFFYIPGTETCLKIGGYVRYDIDIAERFVTFTDNPLTPVVEPTVTFSEYGWAKNARGQLEIDAREETEWGTLRGFIAFQGNSNDAGSVDLDQAFMEIGGLKIGYANSVWDDGIVGEYDSLANVAKYNQIAYKFSSGGFEAIIELLDDNGGGDGGLQDFVPHVAGKIAGTFGAFSARLDGGYDNIAEEGSIRAIVGVDVTEATRLELAGIYSTGANTFYNLSEWTVVAGVAHTFNEQWKLEANAQYWADRNFDFAGSPDRWQIGANVDYTPVKNFLIRGQVSYFDDEGLSTAAGDDVDGVVGKIRFQRSF